MIFIVLMILITLVLLISPTKEGFWERPEFKTKRDNILRCLNNDCVMQKVNNCVKMCKSGVLDHKTQSPGYQRNCEYQCLEFGDISRESLLTQLAVFNRLPRQGDYLPAYI